MEIWNNQSYLSALATLFKLKGENVNVFSSFATKTALRGVRNLDEIYLSCQVNRKVFSYPLLLILGHSIANTTWNEQSKSLFWTLSCVLFFGSFRISEVLAKSENEFDPSSTLTWNDVLCCDEYIRFRIKSPKVFVQGGVTVDLFAIENQTTCPVSCMKRFKQVSSIKNKTLPVFMFNNGKLLTPHMFNKTFRELLSHSMGEDAKYFSSYSFRAAIPAALANHPNIASQEAVMGWGRWESKAYEKYTRLKFNKRKETFLSVCSIFEI
jgi:hypothetical protein